MSLTFGRETLDNLWIYSIIEYESHKSLGKKDNSKTLHDSKSLYNKSETFQVNEEKRVLTFQVANSCS